MKKSQLWLLCILLIAISCLLPSCVHEWPEIPQTRPVVLTVTHDLGWEFYEHAAPGSRAGQTHMQRYQFKVFPAGETKYPVSEKIMTVEDDSRSDFQVTLFIPAGDYDIYVWSDNVPAELGGTDHHFDTSDFNSITYTLPYKGNDRQKEAYKGKTTVSVPASVDEKIPLAGTVNLSTPLTSYAFVSTDLEKFMEAETAAGKLKMRGGESGEATGGEGETEIPDIRDYTVKVNYTYYHPNVYDPIKDKPVNSATGVGYTASIEPLDNGNAMICFDHFFINGSESGTRVSLELYDPDGEKIGSTPAMDLPVKRGRCTIVRGEFLTSKASGTTGINPGFDGEFNVEIR